MQLHGFSENSETGIDVAINDRVTGQIDRLEALNKPEIRQDPIDSSMLR